jgi:hypothetical protein
MCYAEKRVVSEKSSGERDREEGDGFDVVLLRGKTADGEGASVIRMRPGQLEAGEVRPLKEGRPLQGGGQVVRLASRPGIPNLYDVNVQYEAPSIKGVDAAALPAGGPPQVATSAYRESWDRTFGSSARVKTLPN